MKTQTKVSVTLQRLAIGAALCLVVATGLRTVLAFNPQPDPPGMWGMLGITASETARVNVVNVVLPNVPPGPCAVQLNFFDSRGGVMKSQTFTVNPKQSAFLEITGGEAGGGFRNSIHPVLRLATNSPAGCNALGTVEVYDTASGKTSILANPIYVPPIAAAPAATGLASGN